MSSIFQTPLRGIWADVSISILYTRRVRTGLKYCRPDSWSSAFPHQPKLHAKVLNGDLWVITTIWSAPRSTQKTSWRQHGLVIEHVNSCCSTYQPCVILNKLPNLSGPHSLIHTMEMLLVLTIKIIMGNIHVPQNIMYISHRYCVYTCT